MADGSLLAADIAAVRGIATLNFPNLNAGACAVLQVQTGNVLNGDIILVTAPPTVAGIISFEGRQQAVDGTAIAVLACNHAARCRSTRRRRRSPGPCSRTDRRRSQGGAGSGRRPPGSVRKIVWYPRQDSNLRFRLRRAALYPLSYGGSGYAQTLPADVRTGVKPVRSAAHRRR